MLNIPQIYKNVFLKKKWERFCLLYSAWSFIQTMTWPFHMSNMLKVHFFLFSFADPEANFKIVQRVLVPSQEVVSKINYQINDMLRQSRIIKGMWVFFVGLQTELFSKMEFSTWGRWCLWGCLFKEVHESWKKHEVSLLIGWCLLLHTEYSCLTMLPFLII